MCGGTGCVKNCVTLKSVEPAEASHSQCFFCQWQSFLGHCKKIVQRFLTFFVQKNTAHSSVQCTYFRFAYSATGGQPVLKISCS